ncbi:MAG: carboxypeptidase regulatory-like domain-containing protein [Gemmatimonadales bacterium]
MMQERRTWGWVGALGVALSLSVGFPEDSLGQDTRSTIAGRVVQSETGEPISGARIRLINVRKQTKTDSVGRFVFERLQPGPYLVEVLLIGLSPLNAVVDLGESELKNIEFRTDSVGVLLPTIYVEGEPQPELIRVLSKFERRMAHGNGRFITREQIIQRNPMRLMDLLRQTPGVRSNCRGPSCDLRLTQGPGACPPAVWLDDVRTTLAAIDATSPSNVAGIELYRGPSETPPEINNEQARCGGAIVIWTRRGLSR